MLREYGARETGRAKDTPYPLKLPMDVPVDTFLSTL